MLEILERILTVGWRHSGATFRELAIEGSHVWLADFPAYPRPHAGARRERRAPTLVLLHGLGASSASFHPVIAPLRKVFRLVIPDLPGYGRSRPPDGKAFLTFAELQAVAEQLLDVIAPGGAYVAGNSMGGWLAAKLAARRPDRVRGIALLNPGGPALQAEDWVEFTRLIAAEGVEATTQLMTRLFHRPPRGAHLFARDLWRLMHRPSVVNLLTTLTPEDFLSEEELRAVRCPAVLVWGEEDRLIPEGCRSFFLEKLPSLRYEPVPDCGHCPQIECPRRTAAVLAELPHMAEIAAPAPAPAPALA